MIKITRRKMRGLQQWKYVGTDDTGKYAAVIAYPNGEMTPEFDNQIRSRIRFVLEKENRTEQI